MKITTYSNLCKSLLILVWDQSTRQSGGHLLTAYSSESPFLKSSLKLVLKTILLIFLMKTALLDCTARLAWWIVPLGALDMTTEDFPNFVIVAWLVVHRSLNLWVRVRIPLITFFNFCQKKFHLCGNTNKQTNRQTDKQTNRQTDIWPSIVWWKQAARPAEQGLAAISIVFNIS